MNSKQRAYLRSLASKIDSVFQVGKNGVTPEVVKSVDESLEKRELVKGTALNNCLLDINDIAEMISERTQSETVQIIGKKIVFFRQSKKNPAIDISKYGK